MDRNRRTRGIVRSAVTRALTQIDHLLQDENTTELDLRLQLDYLNQKESDLIHLERDIQTSTSDDDLEDELEGAEEYRLRISHNLTSVRHALDSRVSMAQHTNILPNVPDDRTQPGGIVPTPTSRSHRTVALPKLQVPTFAGSRRDWQGFWDHFDCTIHTNSELPPMEKFKYLLTYLTDDAKRAVEGIRLSEQNYDLAVQIHKTDFGRRDILIDDHIDRLLSLPAVNSSTNAEQLRRPCDAIRFPTTSLQGPDVPPSNYAVVLHRALMRCFPADLAILYRQKLREAGLTPSADTPDMRPEEQVRVIMSFLQTEVEVYLSRPTSATSDNPHPGGLREATATVVSAPTTNFRSSAVWLQTARTHLLLRLLLDSGCQRTFIRQDISEKLGCEVAQEELTIYTFGNTATKRSSADIIPAGAQGRVDNVGILIGSNFYWQVVTGRIQRMTDYLTAVESIFGWMVQERTLKPTAPNATIVLRGRRKRGSQRAGTVAIKLQRQASTSLPTPIAISGSRTRVDVNTRTTENVPRSSGGVQSQHFSVEAESAESQTVAPPQALQFARFQRSFGQYVPPLVPFGHPQVPYGFPTPLYGPPFIPPRPGAPERSHNPPDSARRYITYNKGRRYLQFKVGDLVLRITGSLSDAARGFTTSLTKGWEGPYRVSEKLSNLSYEVVHRALGRMFGSIHAVDFIVFYEPDVVDVSQIPDNNDPDHPSEASVPSLPRHYPRRR
ncbi:hypothetical protein HPB47_010977 [Ixodes persulcatus]|uniref:Uncharacterized protein n=1 Tax=Ixodes persulcatus TaxID=34615 RepID=A0AC60NXP1_IXOPE|nr:hypothetical protein HPB47_010977 [Ixodes persulcatus]